MAKVKSTENGNRKVTMSPAQFELVHAILGHVRLGNTGNAAIMADLAIEMFKFSGDAANFDMIKFTTEDHQGNPVEIEDVTIETDRT